MEKWVSFYFEDYQVQPKAFLIVNTFQQTELKDRDAVAFPHQMLRFSKGRDHCLITTTQLLGLYFECQAHPEKKDELIQSLFDKSGVYEGFQDWNTFITHEEDSRSLEG